MNKDLQGAIVVFTRPRTPGVERDVRVDEHRKLRALLSRRIDGLAGFARYELRPREFARTQGNGIKWRREDYEHLQTGRFATIFEVNKADPTAVYAAIKSAGGFLSDHAELVYEGCYKLDVVLYADGYNPGEPPVNRGILIAMTHSKDIAKHDAWYGPTHLDDERRHGIHHTITRLINCQEGAVPRSLSILETDWADISEARAQIEERYVADFRWPEGIQDAFEVIVASDYQRIL